MASDKLNNLVKDNSLSNNFSNVISPIKPNSKIQYIKYFSEIQANNLANKMPTFDFKNKEVNNLFNQFLSKNKFLWKYQKLEKQIFTEGLYAVGLEYIKDNDNLKHIPIIQTAKVLSYEYKNFELYKLKLQVDKFTSNSIQYKVIEEYDLSKSKDQNKIDIYIENGIDNSRISAKNSQYKLKEKVNRYLNFIPWVIFQNRPDEISDIELVNNEWFLSLDHTLECYWQDSYLSSPWIFVSDTLGGSDVSENLQKSIYDLKSRIFKSNNFSELLEGDAPIRVIQANSQGQILIQKINEDMARIEKFIFAKKDTKNFGTKNLQTAEVEQVNSDFEDYYEFKANLREDNFKDFMILWIKILDNHGIKFENLNENNFEVMVVSSTKWWEKKEKENLEKERVKINHSMPEKKQKEIENAAR